MSADSEHLKVERPSVWGNTIGGLISDCHSRFGQDRMTDAMEVEDENEFDSGKY